MAEGLQQTVEEAEPQVSGPATAVSACTTSPGKLVFIESGNTDGWIATDAAVEARP